MQVIDLVPRPKLPARPAAVNDGTTVPFALRTTLTIKGPKGSAASCDEPINRSTGPAPRGGRNPRCRGRRAVHDRLRQIVDEIKSRAAASNRLPK